jgi:hypothetical protein
LPGDRIWVYGLGGGDVERGPSFAGGFRVGPAATIGAMITPVPAWTARAWKIHVSGLLLDDVGRGHGGVLRGQGAIAQELAVARHWHLDLGWRGAGLAAPEWSAGVGAMF